MTSSPRPDESGWNPPRRPDSTDPDLAPVPALAETGRMSPYQDATDGGYMDEDGDPEAVEDGIRGARDPGAVAVAARLSRRPRDMVISIGVLLAVVFALFGLYRCLGGDEAAVVDPGPVYAEARAAKAFPVAEPSGLGADWQPVSAQYQPHPAGAVIRVGWRTPDDGSIQLVEGNLSPDVMLTGELGSGAREVGEVDINGTAWTRYEVRKGEQALVLQQPERTIIVVGRASQAELTEFAASLK